jgi:hypothetical protein
MEKGALAFFQLNHQESSDLVGFLARLRQAGRGEARC